MRTSPLAQVTTTMTPMAICSIPPSCFRRRLLGFETTRCGDSLASRRSSLSPDGMHVSRRVITPSVLHASFEAPTCLTVCSFAVSAASSVSCGRFMEPVVPPMLDRNSSFHVRSVAMAERLSPN